MVFSVDDSPYFTVNCACAAYTVGYCGSTNGWFTSNPGGAQVDTLSPPPILPLSCRKSWLHRWQSILWPCLSFLTPPALPATASPLLDGLPVILEGAQALPPPSFL